MSDIKYKIVTESFCNPVLYVSTRKSFWMGKDIWEGVPILQYDWDSTYSLKKPKLEVMYYRYFDGDVSKDMVYKFMGEHNTKEKYLNYVKSITDLYNSKYEEYLKNKDLLREKFNLYE